MPWASIAYPPETLAAAKTHTRLGLADRFTVEGFPTLLVLDPKTGSKVEEGMLAGRMTVMVYKAHPLAALAKWMM